ncbi:hypothetical protein [Saccharopolyspora sp. ASAGF58]|uniref:hypothetical protein n=1 Tax=Saccharopolyspora sp. ASAGF58 TaxID=2719023 RepID=UPI00143FDF81|nr:hypothetical protein [Saccharopolyspora sp. ASAGF58]QIZ35917.1 hypothetical protein FDZ84_15985 [Saccharopolyspora sp. ASAGF58]
MRDLITSAWFRGLHRATRVRPAALDEAFNLDIYPQFGDVFTATAVAACFGIDRRCFSLAFLATRFVGVLRLEIRINNAHRVHPGRLRSIGRFALAAGAVLTTVATVKAIKARTHA